MKLIEKGFSTISICLFALCFGVFALTSCTTENSDDVNQDRIYMEYELFYDKPAAKTYAVAFFKFGSRTGTPLKLTGASEVKFNGQAIPYDSSFAYYRLEMASPPANPVLTGTFTFKDKDGKTFSNTINVARAIENPDINTITKSAGTFTYTWNGGAVAANEAVGLAIVNVANPLMAPQAFVQSAVGATNIVVAAPQVSQFPTGPAYLTVDRIFEVAAPSANATGAGGLLRGKYRASKIIDIQP